MKYYPFAKITLVVILTLSASVALFSQNLRRKASWGTSGNYIDTVISNIPLHGLLIQNIAANSTSEKIGVRANDLLVSLNGIAISSRDDLVKGLKELRENDPVRVEVYRNGNKKLLKGNAVPKPLETYENAEVLYGEIPFNSGYLRNIMIRPKGATRVPVVFLIQGYTCSSMDNLSPDHPYQKITLGLLEKGYAVYKMEKPGMGDCLNTGECDEIDYTTEQAAFQAGFEQLEKFSFVDQNNIFVFGHSMGGIIAPMLKQKFPIRGIAVYGTGIKSWFEYFVEMYRKQWIYSGADYVENDLSFHKKLPFCYEFMVLKKSPKELAKNPVYAEILKEDWHWDGENKLESRSYRYWQQLQEPGLFEAWKNLESHVLAVWGASDFVAFSKEEHTMTIDVVNHYHPGKGKYLEIPESDHAFTQTKDQFDSANHWGDWNYMKANFNPAIIRELDLWMKKIMQENP